MTTSQPRYIRPDWFTAHVFNPVVRGLTRLGVSVYGSRILAVRGRKSGQWRTTPVSLLEFRGQRYLVAPRGVTEWVRNIRATGQAELRLGSRREPIRVTELSARALTLRTRPTRSYDRPSFSRIAWRSMLVGWVIAAALQEPGDSSWCWGWVVESLMSYGQAAPPPCMA